MGLCLRTKERKGCQVWLWAALQKRERVELLCICGLAAHDVCLNLCLYLIQAILADWLLNMLLDGLVYSGMDKGDAMFIN